MKSDQEILAWAWRELGWKPEVIAGAVINTGPKLLTSLDAHFAPGGTVEMFKKTGLQIMMGIRADCGWYAALGTNYAKAETLPRALTLVFLKWRQPQENWE